MIVVWILSYFAVFILGAATVLGLLLLDHSRMEKRAQAAFNARMEEGERQLQEETVAQRETVH